MISLPNLNSYELLPPNLKTPHHYALCYAFDNQMKKLLEYSQIAFFYCVVPTLPENMLDLISENFSITGYNREFDIEIKRELILEAFLIKSKLGTPYAVEKIVSTIFGSGFVEEWFDYGGDPYYFRINSANPEIMRSQEKEFLQVLEKTKNERSWLDKIRIILDGEATVYIGTGYHELSIETYTSLDNGEIPVGEVNIFTGMGYYEKSKETYVALT